MKKNILFLFITLCFIPLFISSCYFTNVPVYPSAAAFHNVEYSPFLAKSERITAMATDGEFTVAVSYNGTIAWSDDHGINWQTFVTVIDEFDDGVRFNTVTYAEGWFFAGGDGGKAAYSTDGKVWYNGVIGPMSPKNILAVAVGIMYNQIVFVAAGTDGRIAYALNSPTGPWTHVSFSPFGDRDNYGESINGLVYGKVKGNGIFVAVGDTGKFAVMNDFSGKLYGPSSVSSRHAFRAVTYGKERFVAVGEGALIRISAEPETYSWITVRDHDFGLRPFSNIAYDADMEYFILISKNNDGTPVVGFSPTGEIWSAISLASRFVKGISAVVCTNKRIILGGEDGMIVYSN